METQSYDNILICAVCCLPFLWFFLRVSEFTITKDTSYVSECHLLFSDIVVDKSEHPQHLKVAIKQSKTDINLYLGATNRMLRTVKALLPYLAIRPEQANCSPFLLKDRCPCTHVPEP